MARVDLTQGAINSRGVNGFQEATATFDTLVAGDNNGIIIPWQANGYIALQNLTPVPGVVFTVKTPQPASYAQHGLVIPDQTFSVDIGEILQIPFSGIQKQLDNNVYVDCDVAGEVAIVVA